MNILNKIDRRWEQLKTSVRAPHAIEEQGRSSERYQTRLPALALFAGRHHDATVLDLSSAGMMLHFDQLPSLFKGALIVVEPEGLSPVAGEVRWIRDSRCGINLSTALPLEFVEAAAGPAHCSNSPRPGRLRLKLPAMVVAPDLQRQVLIENISAGGMMLNVSLQKELGIMVHIEGLLPLGGHVRWSSSAHCGVMLTRLMSIAVATDIQRRCNISPLWLDEVIAAHRS